ncbi:MAG: hypothetical protein HC836_16845 [Richelia sp. RM2_1_2]|nr:hypothetical protein [Richelia sp. RM2_1_2]
MKKTIITLFCVLLATPVLAGGDNFELGTALETARVSVAPKSKFKRAMFNEFIRYSEIELREGDLADADTYAVKAISLSKGERVKLSDPAFYAISETDRTRLSTVRNRLVKVLPKSAKSKPELAAKAVTLYECALMEAEETPRDCERGLMVILERFENKVK